MPKKKRKPLTPADKHSVKAIKAFNERLTYARKRYGEDSAIVEAMVNEARKVVKLKWDDKTGKIRNTRENLGVLRRAWEREEFNKYIAQNSAKNLLESKIYTRSIYRKGLEGTKGKKRIELEEKLFQDYLYMKDMYEAIWKDVYKNSSGDSEERKERATRCYLAAKSELNYTVVKLYGRKKLDVNDIIDILDNGVSLKTVLEAKRLKAEKAAQEAKKPKATKQKDLEQIAYFNNDYSKDEYNDPYFDTSGDDYP